jgi:hypothetical protein
MTRNPHANEHARRDHPRDATAAARRAHRAPNRTSSSPQHPTSAGETQRRVAGPTAPIAASPCRLTRIKPLLMSGSPHPQAALQPAGIAEGPRPTVGARQPPIELRAGATNAPRPCSRLAFSSWPNRSPPCRRRQPASRSLRPNNCGGHPQLSTGDANTNNVLELPLAGRFSIPRTSHRMRRARTTPHHRSPPSAWPTGHGGPSTTGHYRIDNDVPSNVTPSGLNTTLRSPCSTTPALNKSQPASLANKSALSASVSDTNNA